jgi:predicted AlkP superfamily phosphohydrolase/phosphomutase
MSARLLMIALDGADGALLDRWSADGTLPNLAALRARGGATRLSAPEGITDDALWASFQYSAGLGGHGRYHWLQRLDSGKMDMAYLNEAGREAFWHTISSQGARVAVFDVPKCGLPGPMNGIHLVDWLVHGRYFSEPKSYPESLAAEVVGQFGPAPPSRCGDNVRSRSNADLQEVIANLRTSVARKRCAGLHYVASETWDLFVIAFKEAHCAGHQLWDLADPRHADHDPARAALLGEPYRTILMDLDAAVGDLVAAVGQNAPIAVFSTSDMEPNATLEHLMPEIVNRMNRRLGENRLTRALRRIMRRLTSTAPPMQPCELLPYNENCTALRVNPKQHLLRRSPGNERTKAEMLERVEYLLRELTDADTGQPVVAAIDRPSAKYNGPRAAALPDLLIRYKTGTLPRAVVSPRLGRIEAERPPVRPGNHASGGFLIFAGESFADVKAMHDLGPVAARVLQGAIS